MNYESIDIAKKLNLADPNELLRKSIGQAYPMVIWRLPNQEHRTAIIDLRPDLKKEVGELHELSPGFTLNSFENQHPINPDFIKADVLIQFPHQDAAEVLLNPTVGSGVFDRWAGDLENPGAVLNDPIDLNESPSYEGLVEASIKKIKESEFDKVVLSRYKDLDLPETFDPMLLFEKADKLYPNAFVYLLYHPNWGLWLGATPESIISIKDGSLFKTVALAGTQRIQDGQSLSEIAWTQKEIEEQAIVSRYIIDCFKKIRLREFKEMGPKTVKAGILAHLKTEYEVNLQEVNMPNLGDIMLELLHPTSAVCGMPLKESLDFIHENEGYDRELYSGFLGPVNISGSTEIFVNLRCMRIGGRKARLFAGAGITEDSNAEKEFVETQMKMKTMEDLLQK